MPEYWTKYPRMDYWPDYPDRWLLSVKATAMSNRAYGAYHRITCHMRRENLPGVILADDNDLMDLGRIRPLEWKADAKLILAAFRVYADGTLHHEFIKKLYRESCERVFSASMSGRKGGRKSGGKGKKTTDSALPDVVLLDPYSRWERVGSWRGDDDAVFDSEKGCLRVPKGALACDTVPLEGLSKRVRERDSNDSLSQAVDDSPVGGGVAPALDGGGEKLGTQLKKKMMAAIGAANAAGAVPLKV